MEIHGLSMLNCLITIGDEDPNDTLHILNKITVNEVVNLQIKDSYQTLINTATVEFLSLFIPSVPMSISVLENSFIIIETTPVFYLFL